MKIRRVLLFITLLFCIGLFSGIALYKFYLLFLALTILTGFLSLYMYFKGRAVYCLIFLCIFFCGMWRSGSSVNLFKTHSLSFSDKYISMTGQISGDVAKEGNVSTYTLYADTIECDGIIYTGDCSIKIIDYKNKTGYMIPYNEVTLSGKFEGKGQYKNTGMSGYDDYLMIKGIAGTVTADYISGIKSHSTDRRYIEHRIYDMKSKITEALSKYLNEECLPLMKGVLFGDTSGIGKDDYESFKRAGVVHIFAVSGYNIWILYYILSHMLFFLKAQGKLKNAIIILLLGLYTALAGGTASVIRAYVMASVSLVGTVIRRRSDPLTSLSLAGILILSANPLAIADIGFQLSFISVLSIILLLPKLRRINLPLPGFIYDMLISSLAVQIGILPLIAYYFNSVPILSIVSNIIIVPLVSLFTVLGIGLCLLLFLLPGFSYMLSAVINILGDIIVNIASYIGTLKYANITVMSPTVVEIVFYYVSAALLLGVISVKVKYKWIAAYGAALLIIFSSIKPMLPGKLTISFIDVGQGDCILVITPDRKVVLIDGGGKPKTPYSDFDVGEKVVKPYLLKHGISSVDMVISTHSHDDHLLGLIPVLESFNVGSFVKSERDTAAYSSIVSSGYTGRKNIVSVSMGDIIKAGKYVTMDILNPIGQAVDENDDSIVMKLRYKEFSLLLTGDISVNIENRLMEQPVESDVLKIPHHGSASSMNSEFLKAVNPKTAIICVGKNSFGHPAQNILELLKKNNIPVFRTDIDGEITVITDGINYTVKCAVSR